MEKIFCKNKRARFDYKIEKEIESGIMLTGSEVKSIRNGRVSLKGSFIKLKDGAYYLFNANIPKWDFSFQRDYDPTKNRKLLLHSREINKLRDLQKTKNMYLIPLALYKKRKWIKLKIGIGKSKKKYDKREQLRKKDQERIIKRDKSGSKYW